MKAKTIAKIETIIGKVTALPFEYSYLQPIARELEKLKERVEKGDVGYINKY